MSGRSDMYSIGMMMYNITTNWENGYHLYAIENACILHHSTRPEAATVMAMMRMKRDELARQQMALKYKTTIYKVPVILTMAAPEEMAY